jgi:hypothetical protein
VQYHEYPVLLAEAGPASGEATWALARLLMARGLTIIPAQSQQDVRNAVAASIRIGAAVLDWELFRAEPELFAMVADMAELGGKPPVVLISGRAGEPGIPAAAASRARGSFWLRADSPGFIARQVELLVREHAGQLSAAGG